VGFGVLAAAVGLGIWLLSEPLAQRLPPSPPEPEAKRKELAKNVFIEVQGDKRRVVIKAAVCLREGALEGLMCRKQTKEHEYILAADADAKMIHAALLAAGAKQGHPVKFEPKFVPPTGSTIKVTLQYQKDGKLVRVPAQEWIRAGQTGKEHLKQDWVFAGSLFVKNQEEPGGPDIYLANFGDLICVVNMESAMLDLTIRSPKALDDRVFTAFTERIPPRETTVDVILEAVPEKKP
jgi:hypothetical protein